MTARPAWMRHVVVALASVGLVLGSVAPVSAVPPPNVVDPTRLGFPNGDDWEPAIAADEYGHVYVLWTHYVGFGGSTSGDPDESCPGCASPHSVLQVSSDGGATFSAPRAPFPATTRQDDPQIVVDPADGRTVYAAYMQDNKSSEYVARSDDFGVHWHPVLVEQLGQGTDKDILAVRGDDIYLAYHTKEKIFVSFSHDGGTHWKTVNMIGSTSEFGESLASGGAIDSNGNVYFAWNGVHKQGQAKGETSLFVTKSTDGGESWTTKLVDVSAPAPRCGCGGWGYWGPQMALAIDGNDQIYVLWNATHGDNGDPERVWFASSSDGVDWSPAADVSNAPTGSNNLFPAIAATGDGDVRIAWMDDRNGHDSGSGDPSARWNTYSRSSSNGGGSWTAVSQISAYVAGYTYKFAQPKDGYLQPYGDYMEIDINSHGKTVGIWGEGNSYFGPGNIWFARQQ